MKRTLDSMTSDISVPVSMKLYNSMIEYADLTFKFGSEEIKANNCILSSYSPYFKALIARSESNTIEIETMSKNTFQYLMLLIYSKNTNIDDLDNFFLKDDELFQAIELLHEMDEKELLKKNYRIYCNNSKNIKRLCYLRLYFNDGNYNERLHIKRIVSILKEMDDKLYIEELDDSDIKFLLEKIQLKFLMDNLEIDFKSYISFEQMKLNVIYENYDQLIKFFDEKFLLNEILKRRTGDVIAIEGKYVILYKIFEDCDPYARLLIPLIKNQKIYEKNPTENGYELEPYKFDRVNAELNCSLNLVELFTKEGTKFSNYQLKYLYYIPTNITLHELNFEES